MRLVASQVGPDELFTAEIRLSNNVYRKIPKSFSKKNISKLEMARYDLQLSQEGIDNLVKGIKDGLSKVIRHDDSQVTALIARKFYSDNP
ncbi:endodeoxyribonuclease RusA [Lysinibacillus sphaericus OT4b.31]|uniref:Endodeoxyribonuclease RusA n=1 Tax=Lysinibacillus sphaericus OT4b.31 TaxID=1285586 RepID=R7ZHJ5_LYSSH|nr:endodeoxyribonuclease RusA [Lysinibacillus sphaericus OT4b.31]